MHKQLANEEDWSFAPPVHLHLTRLEIGQAGEVDDPPFVIVASSPLAL